MFNSDSYEDTSFKSLDCTAKSLQKLSFYNVIFENCNFTNSDWRSTSFSSCCFKNCNLSLIKMDGCRLHDIALNECKVIGVDFYKCDKAFFSLKMNKSIIQTSNFTGLSMKQASFQGCKVRDVYFTETNLTEADFSDADLQGTIFHQCNLTKADFRGAKNYAIDPLSNQIKKAKFSFPEAISLLRSFDIELS